MKNGNLNEEEKELQEAFLKFIKAPTESIEVSPLGESLRIKKSFDATRCLKFIKEGNSNEIYMCFKNRKEHKLFLNEYKVKKAHNGHDNISYENYGGKRILTVIANKIRFAYIPLSNTSLEHFKPEQKEYFYQRILPYATKYIQMRVGLKDEPADDN